MNLFEKFTFAAITATTLNGCVVAPLPFPRGPVIIHDDRHQHRPPPREVCYDRRGYEVPCRR